MRLYYYCVKVDHKKMVRRILVTREGYTLTEDAGEAQYTTDLEGARDYVAQHPELEVCCLDAEPVAVPEENAVSGMKIEGVPLLDVMLAAGKFKSAMADLQAIRPTMFCELDDNSALSVLSEDSLCYDHGDDRIYILLQYPGSREMSM